MSKYKLLPLVLLFSILAACGGGSSSQLTDINTPANETTNINDFSVEGSGAIIGGNIPINANINNGQFNVSWDVDSSDPYHVDVFLSTHTNVDRDVKIFSQNCGSSTLIYNCGAVALFDCRFTTSNKMSCGSISAFNTEKDLTSFLNGLPSQGFLIMEACNALMTNCKTSSIEIELQ